MFKCPKINNKLEETYLFVMHLRGKVGLASEEGGQKIRSTVFQWSPPAAVGDKADVTCRSLGPGEQPAGISVKYGERRRERERKGPKKRNPLPQTLRVLIVR
jgi:hypothetical protein